MLSATLLRNTFAPNTLRKAHVFQNLAECTRSKNGSMYSQFHCSVTCKHVLHNIRQTDVIIRSAVLSTTKLIKNVLMKYKHTENFFVDVNVKQNVLLYESLDKSTSRLLIPTGIIQNFCWLTIAYCAYTPAFWKPKPADVSWKEHMKPIMLKLFICLFSLCLGPLISCIVWMLCARSVKYIILNKGGQKVTLVTYNINKKAAKKCLPVAHVKTTISRREMVNYMPLKILGEKFFYIIDRNGRFYHDVLFDNTIGMNKTWHN